ncbi:hypothetical protein MNBD_DELTA01-481 [hydrothermal vent metagenome]|uniref:Uncharacterized protein n=1 Tax=hydrothermal vent metagenome TaxID=652676 RepID=A0A3B0RH91_9ZZZZ
MDKNASVIRILVVDDNAQNLAFIRDAFSGKNYIIESTDDGDKAPAMLGQLVPNLIFVNPWIRGLSGQGLCAALRILDLDPRPAIILIYDEKEGKEVNEEILGFLDGGADDIIRLPLNKTDLYARARAQLNFSKCYRDIIVDNQNLKSILEITNAIGDTLDTSEILDIIVNHVASVLDAHRCSIVMVGEGDKGYVLVSNDAPEVRDLQIDLGRYPEIREVIRTRDPVSLDDVKTHPLMKEVGELIMDLDYTSIMVVPVTFKEHTLGTLFLRARRKNRGFTAKEIEFCQIVANASYHAFKNAKLFEQVSDEKEDLRHLAITDQLTALFNHSFFYIRLEEEFERAVRYDSPLSLILMDIDDFKRINDTYGHRIGDMVLRETSAVIRNSVRKIDVVARYGGEEIAVLLPQTSLSGALGEAERIRLNIENTKYQEDFDEVITVSLGVATYSFEHTKRPEDLVNLADKALYEAKDAGKNCVKVITEKSLS